MLFLIAWFWQKDLNIRFFALIFASVLLGLGYSIFYSHLVLSDPLLEVDEAEVKFKGYVCSEPDLRIDQSKYEICLLKLKIDDWEDVNFKILITTDLYPEYKYGEVLEGQGKLKKPEKFEDFDYKNYLLTKKIFGIVYKPKITTDQELVTSGNIGSTKYSFFKGKYYLLKIKKRFEGTINRILSEPESSLLSGLILGSKRGFSKDLMDGFNKTGTTHIIALSGFNVTIIIMAIAKLLETTPRKTRFLVSFFLVLLFVVLTGAMASIVRAALMAFLVAIAPLLGRKAKEGNILVFVAVIMLVLNPMILRYDLGFLLSFFALLGLIYLAPLIDKSLDRQRFAKFIPRAVRGPFNETISAQLVAVPLILYNFERISLIAPLTNVLILPLIPLTMLVGFVAALLGMVLGFLGQVVGWFSFVLLKYMIVVIEFFARIPLASIEIEKIHPLWLFGYYLIIVLIVVKYGQKIKTSVQK